MFGPNYEALVAAYPVRWEELRQLGRAKQSAEEEFMTLVKQNAFNDRADVCGGHWLDHAREFWMRYVMPASLDFQMAAAEFVRLPL